MRYLRFLVRAEPADPVRPMIVLVDGRTASAERTPEGKPSIVLQGAPRTDGERPQTVTAWLSRERLDVSAITAWICRDVAAAAEEAGVDIDHDELVREAGRAARRAVLPLRFWRRSR